jgi:hypothetical protein
MRKVNAWLQKHTLHYESTDGRALVRLDRTCKHFLQLPSIMSEEVTVNPFNADDDHK